MVVSSSGATGLCLPNAYHFSTVARCAVSRTAYLALGANLSRPSHHSHFASFADWARTLCLTERRSFSVFDCFHPHSDFRIERILVKLGRAGRRLKICRFFASVKSCLKKSGDGLTCYTLQFAEASLPCNSAGSPHLSDRVHLYYLACPFAPWFSSPFPFLCASDKHLSASVPTTSYCLNQNRDDMIKTNRYDSMEDLKLQRRIVSYLHLRLPDIGSLEVEAQHGTATLRGDVSSMSIYWRCLDCCRRVAGVLNVVDQLVVLHDEEGEHENVGDVQRSGRRQLVESF